MNHPEEVKALMLGESQKAELVTESSIQKEHTPRQAEKEIMKKFCGASPRGGRDGQDGKTVVRQQASSGAVSHMSASLTSTEVTRPSEQSRPGQDGEPISPAEHTPAPWKVSDFRGCIELTAYGQSVCEVAPYIESQIQTLITRKTGKANAELICRAVNSHEALVSALRALVDESQAILEYVDKRGGCDVAITALNEAREVLASVSPKEKAIK